MIKDIDGTWLSEPWGAKIVKEANAKILVDERDLWPNGDFVTAHIIVRTDYLKNNPDVVKKLLEAHVDETKWINEHPDEAMKAFNVELEKLTGKAIPEDEFKAGYSDDPDLGSNQVVSVQVSRWRTQDRVPGSKARPVKDIRSHNFQ